MVTGWQNAEYTSYYQIRPFFFPLTMEVFLIVLNSWLLIFEIGLRFPVLVKGAGKGAG